ncbi:hypothetical protein NHE_0864 [Neorickettsia helminthoeca str. Oregon]|uniref:Uncharacterized protein n=1 Tax=Neorickettsia helminthoeca str. Oregon TaxID=1286528 RepID=X5HL05_9RICK|nr:hypothetical protein [Neorickettsia helminthoeca]AHX11784.1 hypothetical protein NHE_0864 [Neorickettsia helminthoeca str. Oregon]
MDDMVKPDTSALSKKLRENIQRRKQFKKDICVQEVPKATNAEINNCDSQLSPNKSQDDPNATAKGKHPVGKPAVVTGEPESTDI